MKLDKNGYRSKKRDSFATAVKVLIFIFGLGAVVAAVCMYAMFSGCGSNGSGDEPVYDENGNCLENCSNECPSCGYFEYIDGKKICMLNNCVNNGDSWVAAADSYYPSGDISSPEPEYIAPPCKVPTDPKIKKMCMPLEAKKAQCIFYDYTTDSNPDCDLSKTDHCWCSGWLHDQDDCSSQAQCQQVPCEEWPPEVCQGLPCLLVGKWDCIFGISSSGKVSSATYDYTGLEFYDNGDEYCRFDDFNYKPGDSVIRSNYGEVIKLTKFCNSPGANELLYLQDLKACESDEDCTDFPSGPCKGIDAWGDDGLCAGDSWLRYKCQSSDNCNYVPDNNFCNGGFCHHGSFPCTSDEDCQEASTLYRTCLGACAETGETCEYIHGSDTCLLNIKSTCNLKLEGWQKIDAEGNITAQCFKIKEE